MAIGPEFIAKLLPALDELEERWRLRKISADKAIDFCLTCQQRLGSREEFQAIRDRVQVTLDAAFALRESSPKYIHRDLAELERRWGRERNDNYRDDFEECNALLGRTAPRSPQRARVLAVLASVLAEATKVAEDPSIREYLGAWLDREAWERDVEQRLPKSRPRASFKKSAAANKPASRKPAANKPASKKRASKKPASK
ncbi:MAG: hypothetical protein H0V17_10415 [Deltaproteobacteria bacterium]|nr:hypothetical protein [Deltaproteobacteria bacterium]